MRAIGLRIRGGAGWWLLSWGVVAYAFGSFILDVLVGEVLIFCFVDVVAVCLFFFWIFNFCLRRESGTIEEAERVKKDAWSILYILTF